MGDTEEKKKVLSFNLLKIEKGREKLCKCNPPHYIIDEANRIVTCEDCGATLDAFEALLRLCNYMDKFEEYQKEALKRGKMYDEWAKKKWRKQIKNKVFSEMDKQYQNGMLPHCPKCFKVFDPMKILSWTYDSESDKGD